VHDLDVYLTRWDGGPRETWAERMARPGDFAGFGAGYEAAEYPESARGMMRRGLRGG
jgi:hypothetical protein